MPPLTGRGSSAHTIGSDFTRLSRSRVDRTSEVPADCGPTDAGHQRPNRRSRCPYERSARMKSTFRKSGHSASQK